MDASAFYLQSLLTKIDLKFFEGLAVGVLFPCHVKSTLKGKGTLSVNLNMCKPKHKGHKTSKAAHAGTHTQYVFGSRCDSVRINCMK